MTEEGIIFFAGSLSATVLLGIGYMIGKAKGSLEAEAKNRMIFAKWEEKYKEFEDFRIRFRR